MTCCTLARGSAASLALSSGARSRPWNFNQGGGFFCITPEAASLGAMAAGATKGGCEGMLLAAAVAAGRRLTEDEEAGPAEASRQNVTHLSPTTAAFWLLTRRRKASGSCPWSDGGVAVLRLGALYRFKSAKMPLVGAPPVTWR